MELTGDGIADILSGTYSRSGKSMAGLLYVLPGRKDGTFDKAEPLTGADGELLILPMGGGNSDDDILDRICTRPFAGDLDGDGQRDLVVGNFRGTFAWFRGGAKGFEPTPTWLQAGGAPMAVARHGDPFLVDLDGDQDLDLVSGSSDGGVTWFANDGDRKQPRFGAARTLLAAPPREILAGPEASEPKPIALGEDGFTAPGRDTRVWVADVDGDEKLDLLVGDSVTVRTPKPGVGDDEARTKHAAWQKKQMAFFQQPPGDSEADQKKWQQGYEALMEERDAFLTEERTGYVWLLRGK